MTVRITLATLGLACLWIGWSDFDLWQTQEEVRLSIRTSIRWTLQTLVQYVAPVAIAAYLVRDTLASRHR